MFARRGIRFLLSTTNNTSSSNRSMDLLRHFQKVQQEISIQSARIKEL